MRYDDIDQVDAPKCESCGRMEGAHWYRHDAVNPHTGQDYIYDKVACDECYAEDHS